jgi:hypothetical protein
MVGTFVEHCETFVERLLLYCFDITNIQVHFLVGVMCFF